LGTSAGVGTGISLVPSGADTVPAVITGNSFYRLALGINLGANTAGVIVNSNIYTSNTTNRVNAGAGNQIGVAVP
jgi:hypothetical protein